jgi:hypothetical protein
LGWGAEGSRLTVELVRDTCDYPFLKNNNGQNISRSNSADDYTNRRKNKSFEFDENGIDLIPGKVYYVPQGNKLVSFYHFDEDPGFYGDMPPSIPAQTFNPKTFDLIGTPVYFKYDDESKGHVWDTVLALVCLAEERHNIKNNKRHCKSS